MKIIDLLIDLKVGDKVNRTQDGEIQSEWVVTGIPAGKLPEVQVCLVDTDTGEHQFLPGTFRVTWVSGSVRLGTSQYIADF